MLNRRLRVSRLAWSTPMAPRRKSHCQKTELRRGQSELRIVKANLPKAKEELAA